ncbi:hypothetical protein D3C85_1560630 [compost metagenome]
MAFTKRPSRLMSLDYIDDGRAIDQSRDIDCLIFACHLAPVECLVDDCLFTWDLVAAHVGGAR